MLWVATLVGAVVVVPDTIRAVSVIAGAGMFARPWSEPSPCRMKKKVAAATSTNAVAAAGITPQGPLNIQPANLDQADGCTAIRSRT
jgi:hypothetical protein